MELLIVMAIVGIAAWGAYRGGKRLGSRKGYNVGVRRGRRR